MIRVNPIPGIPVMMNGSCPTHECVTNTITEKSIARVKSLVINTMEPQSGNKYLAAVKINF